MADDRAAPAGLEGGLRHQQLRIHADRDVVLKFGLPAIVAAVLGAMALGWLAGDDSALSVHVNDETVAEVTPLKLIVGLLMIGWASAIVSDPWFWSSATA